MINQSEKSAEVMLEAYKQPQTGGMMLSGLPDISKPQVMARHDRISHAFSVERDKVSELTVNLIKKGENAGKNATQIMDDVISLYDSQSELFQTGVGWNGKVFAFN